MSEFTWKFPDLRNRSDLPDLDESPLQVQQWHAHVGDRVEINQPLITLKTEDEDISLTIDSPVMGTIKTLPLVAGQIVHAGDVLAIFDLEE